MAVNTPNAAYSSMVDRWQTMNDVCDGSPAIKQHPYKYLPYPECDDDSKRFMQYAKRAVFYEVTKDTLQGHIGLAFSEDPTFSTDGMDFLKNNADGAGRSIYQLNQIALDGLLKNGRGGFLVDHPSVGDNISKAQAESLGVRPVIVYYDALSIINWRVKKVGGEYRLSLVVLKEVVNVVDADDEFKDNSVNTYRVLRLDEENRYSVQVYSDESGQMTPGDLIYPTRQGKTWDIIPFTFLGSQVNDSSINDIPLEPLANLNLAHYRNSAEYEDSAFLCGQVQPYINELDEAWRDHLEQQGVKLGSRDILMLPSGASFGFAQANPNMVAKEAMDSKMAHMQQSGAKVLEQAIGNKTATQVDEEKSTRNSVLSLCVSNLNEANEYTLKWCADFYGGGYDAKFTIKQDFARGQVTLEELKFYNELALQERISWQTFHEIRTTGKIPEIDYDAEQLLIEAQRDNMA